MTGVQTCALPISFNVAADGVLLLSQAIRRAGRISLPLPGPVVGPASRFFRGAGIIDFSPEQMRLLNFGRVVDTTRLHRQFGFTPRWTTVQAFDDYVRGAALRAVVPAGRVEALERVLLDRGTATGRLLRDAAGLPR